VAQSVVHQVADQTLHEGMAALLGEVALLSVLGGAAAIAAGALATAVYATTKGWSVVVPPLAWAGGLGAALVIGVVAGLFPAVRAARLSPTEALRAV
jgi:putative ABC transport system permease protein